MMRIIVTVLGVYMTTRNRLKAITVCILGNLVLFCQILLCLEDVHLLLILGIDDHLILRV
jgi:hypothetical protein